MPIQQTLNTSHVPVLVWTDDLDEASRQQLANLASLPFAYHHVAAMPDVHLGIGATIGSVLATQEAVVPAAVGVDIGCGMIACRLSLTARQLDEKSLRRVFDQITRDIPVGMAQHDDDRALYGAAQRFEADLNAMLLKHPDLMKTFGKRSKWVNQLGTLGGGNHFIELCLDEHDRVWVMLHSGSRGIGNALATYFIERARKDLDRQHIHLPDRDLAYFREGSTCFDDYVDAIRWAQAYAFANRECMLTLALDALRRHLPTFEVTDEAVNCHHNYLSREQHFGRDVWVTRKGAISARVGEMGIIPGSMGARSYIVRGKGNPDSYMSSAHGAGRRMSRNAAVRRFTEADLQRQTEGVICRKDKGVLDEIPAAYKNIDQVLAYQNDLTETLHTLKQIVCVKG